MENIQNWLAQNPASSYTLTLVGILILAVVSYIISYYLLARGLESIAKRSQNKYDDIIIQRMRPRRLALAVPLLVFYYFAYMIPGAEVFILNTLLFVLMWLGIVTLNGFLDAVNDIYELRRGETGVAIRGYLDIIKILNLLVGIILSISIFTGKSPNALLAGLGAITAVLLLIFRDTILSFVASIQISANDLVVEGDWVEVPAYNADGIVVDITLHQIMIQNWDNTLSAIPTYKLLDSSYKNWRAMSESGGRRIKRAIHIDLRSIHLCDAAMIEKIRRYELVRDYIDSKLGENSQGRNKGDKDDTKPDEAPLLTNITVFRAYIDAFLHNHPKIRKDMTIVVRQLEPGPNGLPIEIYVFTSTTDWIEYEDIQAGIFDHLLAIVPEFELRVFQEPSGSDFESLLKAVQKQ